MKCFEILRYAVHFRYTMLFCFINLGKAEIYILHITTVVYCWYYPNVCEFQTLFSSCFFLGAAQNQEEEMVLVKEPFSVKYKTIDRGRHVGKHTETKRQC